MRIVTILIVFLLGASMMPVLTGTQMFGLTILFYGSSLLTRELDSWFNKTE